MKRLVGIILTAMAIEIGSDLLYYHNLESTSCLLRGGHLEHFLPYIITSAVLFIATRKQVA